MVYLKLVGCLTPVPDAHLIGRKNVLEHQDAENSEKAHRLIYFANVLIDSVSNELKNVV